MLHRYNFDIFNDTLQAKRPFKDNYSFARFFSGNPDLDSYNPIDNTIGINDPDGKIISSLIEIRKTAKNHFKSANVPLFSKKDNLSSDFDLILRVKECV